MQRIKSQITLIVFCGFLCALAITSVCIHRWERTQDIDDRAMNLLSTYSALRVHEGFFLHLPDANNLSDEAIPRSSWRFTIAPLWGNGKLKAQLDQDWDSEANLSWREFGSPIEVDFRGRRRHFTRIFAIVDSDTAIRTTNPRQLADQPPWQWVAVSVADSTHPWMKPGDLSVADLHELLTNHATPFGIVMDKIFHVLTADGHVIEVSSSVPWSMVLPFIRHDSRAEERVAIAAFTRPVRQMRSF